MPKIKKIRILSFAIFQTVTMATVGLIAGILYSFGGLLIDTFVTIGWIKSQETPGLSFGTVLAFGSLIGMPIIFAIFGFMLGIVVALTYNLFAKLFYKMEIDFEQ